MIMLAALLYFVATIFLHAEPEVFFGEDVSPWRDYGNDVPRQDPVNSRRVAMAFRARLANAVTESFESFATNRVPNTLTFGTNLVSLDGHREISEVLKPTETDGGGFPGSGLRFMVLVPDANSGGKAFSKLTFATPHAAFGFFGTDVEVNTIDLVFKNAAGKEKLFRVPVSVPQASGGAFYFGVIDKADPFVSVEFINTGNRTDGFGFDDMTIGIPSQVIAVPGELSIAFYPGLWVQGTVGGTYRIEYTESIPPVAWTQLTNLVLTRSPTFFLDGTGTNRPMRYYQAVPLQ